MSSLNISKNYKTWEGTTAPGTQAIIVPKIGNNNPLGLQNFKRIAWLVEWHPLFSGNSKDLLCHLNEQVSNEGMEEKEFREHTINCWTQIVDGVTLFNRLAIELHPSNFYKIATFISNSDTPLALHGAHFENQTLDKITDWSELKLPNISENGDQLSSLAQVLSVLGKPLEKASSIETPETQNSTFFPSLNWVRLRKTNTELWFSAENGQDIRILLLDALSSSPQLLEHLNTEPKQALKVTIIKINPFDPVDNVVEQKIGDMLILSVLHLSVSSLDKAFADFTLEYQNLKTVDLTGLPFKSEDSTCKSEITMVIRSPTCLHANPFTSYSLKYVADINPRIGQLPSTCSNLISPLDIYDGRVLSLGKTLSEGYFYAFCPASKTSQHVCETPLKYTHVLRVIAGQVFLICLQQVDQSFKPVKEVKAERSSQEKAFHEYFKKHIILPNIRTMEDCTKPSQQPGVVLLNPVLSRTLDGTRTNSSGLASYPPIPAFPKMAVETGWLAHILSFSEGDESFRTKVFSSTMINKVKKIFIGETPPTNNTLRQHLDILCHANVDHSTHTLIKPHQVMFLTGLRDLIRIWSEINPLPEAFLQDALNDVQKRRVILNGSIAPVSNSSASNSRPPTPNDRNLRPGFHPPQTRPLAGPFAGTPRGPSFISHTQNIRPPTPWNRPSARPSIRPQLMTSYLKPEFYDVSTDQASWLSNLGSPDNLLYRYWASQQDSNISLQTSQVRKNTDFEARQL